MGSTVAAAGEDEDESSQSCCPINCHRRYFIQSSSTSSPSSLRLAVTSPHVASWFLAGANTWPGTLGSTLENVLYFPLWKAALSSRQYAPTCPDSSCRQAGRQRASRYDARALLLACHHGCREQGNLASGQSRESAPHP